MPVNHDKHMVKSDNNSGEVMITIMNDREAGGRGYSLHIQLWPYLAKCLYKYISIHKL